MVDPGELKSVVIDMLLKRIDKINEIDFSNPSSFIELRKRVLQCGAISVKLLEQIVPSPPLN